MADTKKEEVVEEKKIDYNQLKAYADNISQQATKIFKENQMLKATLNSRDIEFAFKALEFKDLFSKEFIKKTVDKLEELLTPMSEEEVKAAMETAQKAQEENQKANKE